MSSFFKKSSPSELSIQDLDRLIRQQNIDIEAAEVVHSKNLRDVGKNTKTVVKGAALITAAIAASQGVISAITGHSFVLDTTLIGFISTLKFYPQMAALMDSTLNSNVKTEKEELESLMKQRDVQSPTSKKTLAS